MKKLLKQNQLDVPLQPKKIGKDIKKFFSRELKTIRIWFSHGLMPMQLKKLQRKNFHWKLEVKFGLPICQSIILSNLVNIIKKRKVNQKSLSLSLNQEADLNLSPEVEAKVIETTEASLRNETRICFNLHIFNPLILFK